MIDYKKAGQRIKKQRNRLGITQELLSEKIHITPSFYSQIETGSRKAGINTFLSISRELSISLDYILGNSDTEISLSELDETEYKIFNRIHKFTAPEKEMVLDIVFSIDKYKKSIPCQSNP